MTQVPTTSIPYNGSGTINIHINNPSASLGNGMPNGFMPQYTYYPAFCYPPVYYTQQLQNPNMNQNTNVNLNTPVTTNPNDKTGTDKREIVNTVTTNTIPTTTIEQPKKEREVVVLTDNYIKNLENYMRSNNTQVRQDAIKEVLMRFKEDKSRAENPSLTALLNLALQDYNGTIRSMAMSAIQAGYAKGDDLTEKLLKELQHKKDAFNTDAVQATECLLQMAKTKKLVTDNSHQQDIPKKQERKGA